MKAKKTTKRKTTLVLLTALALMLCACAKTPDSIQSNKYSDSELTAKAKESMVSIDKLYDDVDSAYDTDYTKFTLPDKANIDTTVPEKLCNLELTFINAENENSIMRSWVESLRDEFIPELTEEIQTADGVAEIENESNRIKIERYSKPYIMFDDNESFLFLSDDEVETVLRVPFWECTDDLTDDVKECAEAALEMCEKVDSIVGSELDSIVADCYVYSSGSKTFYEVDIAKSYGGIPIQNLISQRTALEEDSNGEMLMSIAMQTYIDFDNDKNPKFYISCDSFAVAKTDEIETALSFKAACDTLEENLSSGVSFEFDDVMLMYEPIGAGYNDDGSLKTDSVVCTPKWYFIQDDSFDTGLRSINYVTVDCISGEINVDMP